MERIQTWASVYQKARELRFREPGGQQCGIASSVRQMWEGIGLFFEPIPAFEKLLPFCFSRIELGLYWGFFPLLQ